MAFHFVYGSQIISYVDINFPSGIVFPSILNSFSDIFPFSFNYVNYLNMLYIYYTFFSWSLLSLFLFSVFWNVFFQLCSTSIILFLPVSILYYTASNLVLGSILIVSALLNSFLRHGWNFFISIYIILSIFLFFIFSSVMQLCPTLCDPMNCSMPGLPVHHQFTELTQTHVHRVGDAWVM